MENQIPWEKIQFYLKNEREPFDEVFMHWLEEKESNRKFWEETRLMYSLTGEIPGEFEPDKVKAWSEIDQRTSSARKWQINRFYLRIAASILLVALGASATWFVSTQMAPPMFTEVYSPYGHKTMIILPDSSKVWLNGDTRLRYEANFAHSRNVELNGEALFEVRKDHRKVFSVKSSDLTVEVYGTKFNVKHYPDDVNTEVALLNGRVGLFKDHTLMTKMLPGEVVDFDRNENQFSKSYKNLDQIISWSKDELVVENESFDNVLKYLERWYGVQISKDQDLVINQRLTFKVKTESLQELLSIINRVSPFQYKIDGKKVLIYAQQN